VGVFKRRLRSLPTDASDDRCALRIRGGGAGDPSDLDGAAMTGSPTQPAPERVEPQDEPRRMPKVAYLRDRLLAQEAIPWSDRWSLRPIRLPPEGTCRRHRCRTGEPDRIRQTSIASSSPRSAASSSSCRRRAVAFFVPVIRSIPRPIAEGRVPAQPTRPAAPPIAAYNVSSNVSVLQVDRGRQDGRGSRPLRSISVWNVVLVDQESVGVVGVDSLP